MTHIKWNKRAIDKIVRDATRKAGNEVQEAFDEVHTLFADGGDEDAVRSALSSAMSQRGLNGQAPYDSEMNGTVEALAAGRHVQVRTS